MRRSTLIALTSVSTAAMLVAAPAAAADVSTTVALAQQQDPTGQPGQAADPADPAVLAQDEVELESGQTREQPAQQGAIVVTGTRIIRPTLVSPIPVTSVGIQDLSNQGNVSLGDKLAELPQIRATFTQANSTRFIGTAGINALDLRGLGTSRTLVLTNGRRIITATPGINRPDVNAIPIDLVERIDILTGGSSALYGSDAVAGVVNFVMRRDFSGIRLTGQGGVSSRGDRGSYFVSATGGHNFADGRGNVAVSAEYAKQNTLYFTDRDSQTGAYSGRSQFNLVQNTGVICHPAFVANNPNAVPGLCGTPANPQPGLPAEPSTGDGIPDTNFLSGIRNNNISEGGLFTAACPVAPATGETQAQFQARRARACSGIPNPGSTNALAQFGTTYVFLPDGTLVRNPCVTDFRGFGSANCVGGLGSTLRLTGMLVPGLDRKAINLLTHFEVSPAFEPFLEARYVRVTANQEGQPTFFNNTFRLDNPFLSDQARAELQAIIGPTATGATTFTAQRFNIDFGGRGEQHLRENWQGIGGIRGTFNQDWRYEVSLNYGRLYTYYETEGNLLRQNYANAVNAVRDPVTGQIVCRINSSLDVFPAGHPQAGQVNTTNDDPACVPINLFGQGAPSREALNYILYTSHRTQRANLYDAMAYVAGDMSQLFELPGGPIGFVAGAQWRKETAFAAYDPITSSTECGAQGCTFLNVIPDFRPPDLKVKELFGEVSVPLLRDWTLAQELTLSAAGRYSDYNIGQTGGVFAWNLNGVYVPVRDLRLRAGLARSVRAPTQSDLFSPATQTFINGFVDPCGQQNINAGPIVGGQSVRIANCAAAGVPTTQTFCTNPANTATCTTEPFTNRPASGIMAFNQGNESLAEERGTSFTIGGVFQPRFLPGFSLSVDYYRIKVDDVIFAIPGQTIINQCYDDVGGINNPFCAVVFRRPDGTLAGQSNVLHGGGTITLPVIGPSALITSFNYASLKTSGIDVDAAYRRRFAGNTTLHLRGILSRTLTKYGHTSVSDPDFRDRFLSELGDPEWQGQLSTNVEFGRFNLGHRVRYVHKQTIGAYETQHTYQGRPPTNPDAFPQKWYPSLWFHDFRVDVNATERYKFYLGIDNAFDRLPPLGLLGTESGAPSPVGRFFYAGATARF